MSIVIVGHVDHGKSTIIGRLLADTGSLPDGKLEFIREMCRRTSKPFEYAFLLDALKDERAQGITIDAARCFFKTKKRSYIIIDAPGHIEFLKNMVTGASRAEAALLVIDATEGVRENSRRHGFMLKMLGIKKIAVLINKMDLVDYQESVFQQIVQEYSAFLKQIEVEPSVYIPVSGMQGDNIITNSANTPWYQKQTVLATLDHFPTEKIATDQPFRMPVQDVYKFTRGGDTRRIIAGTIDSGKIRVGDAVIFYPSGKKSKINSIEVFNRQSPNEVEAGWATGFTLTEQIYVKRGNLAVLADETPPKVASRIRVNLFWLGSQSMVLGKEYALKLGSEKVKVKLEAIMHVIDASTLDTAKKSEIGRHDVAECILSLERAIAFDLAHESAQTSRFVIVDDYEIAGGGIILEDLADRQKQVHDQVLLRNYETDNIIWHEGNVTFEDRCKVLGQSGLVVWLTGLSGSGKSTIAVAVEKRLNQLGKAVYRLDGDNIRQGLNADLGFSEADRNENIRRIAEVSALFKDAGIITLVCFISPYRKMREFAREKAGKDSFVEIYVKADLETCRQRDPKGLYKRALNGEIPFFTGISDPYEEPENSELLIDTTKMSVEKAVSEIINLILLKEKE